MEAQRKVAYPKSVSIHGFGMEASITDMTGRTEFVHHMWYIRPWYINESIPVLILFGQRMQLNSTVCHKHSYGPSSYYYLSTVTIRSMLPWLNTSSTWRRFKPFYDIDVLL